MIFYDGINISFVIDDNRYGPVLRWSRNEIETIALAKVVTR